jgi:cell division protein FtsI (penicillin-binding protein 3)
MRNLDPTRAKWIRIRMGVLCGVMGVALGGVVASAWRVQVDDGDAWRETAEKQRQRRMHIEPKRGTLFDRKGAPLAVSVEVPSVSADVVEMLKGIEGEPQQQALLRDASVRIGKALSLDPSELYEKFKSKRRFIWIKRRISGDEAGAIRELIDVRKQLRPVRGLAIDGEGHRYYPARELAGPLLGFVAPDGQGKDGVELALDEDLRGRVEEVKGLRDRGGRLLFSDSTTDEQALAGHDVELSIDEGIQFVAERELDAAQSTYETKGGSVVVIEPSTGDILALASTPGYNPNDYGDFEADSRRDRAVSDRFEPGSVMKVFTLATALAHGTLKPTEQIFCENGSYQVGPVTVHDTHVNDWLTPTQILAKSSNIGALKIGLSLGEAQLYAGFRRFGFGEPTNLPLPGEASGVLRPRGRPWFEVETANAAFGQGISVTAIQLAMGFAAIANGGKLMEPILVRRVMDARGNTVREASPHVRREAVPASVARMIAEMLTAVTEPGGTAVEAAVPGFRVAGKTATAQKVDPNTGKYSQDLFTASFVGFVPAEHPRLVIAVVLDEPMIGRYGGDLAGPVFRRVAEASLRYLGVPPSGGSKAPIAKEDDPARSVLLAMRPKQDDSTALAPAGNGPPTRVPDVTAMPARDAVKVLTNAGFVVRIVGSGRVARQSLAAGTDAPKGSAVVLSLETTT